MTTIVRPADILVSDLQTKPLAAPLSGAENARGLAAFTSDDGRIISGTWEADRGTSRWDFTEQGEIIHLLSGALTVQRDGEEPQDVTPGDSVVFPIGWTGIWTVTEPLRKFYVIYKV